MKSPAFAITAALFLPLAGTAHAERFSAVDGTKLVNICTARDKGVVNDCTAYIEGISDTASFYQRVRPADGTKGAALPAYVCVPTGTTGVQLREVVVAYARANPNTLTLQASGVVMRALHDKFKCPGTTGGVS